MSLILISVVVQVLAILHVLRTGRDMRWLLLILFLPTLGALIYFAVEVLPAMQNNPTARRALQRARQTVDPNRGLREGALDYERSQTVETAARLADELAKAGKFDEAIRVCNEARTGVFEDDPKILLALANAQFAAQRHADTIATLDYLRAKNPDFRTADGHLIYARALEESGASDRALEEYESLARYFPGVEARVRQALLYKKLGQADEAAARLAAVLKDARLAPKHFRRSQREWLDIAQRESTALVPRDG
jgi:hypothetical protein